MRIISHMDDVNTTTGVMSKLLLTISVAALFLFIPFVILSFSSGKSLLGLGTLGIVFFFATNIWALKNRPWLSEYLIFYGLIPITIFHLSYAIKLQNIIGVLWCYPAIIACYYFLPETKARIANFAIVLFTFPVIWTNFEIHLVVRIYITIILVSLLAATFINLINQQQRALRKTATTDFLTGVLNRTLLQSCLEEALDQHQRSKIPMTLAAIDLDHFKVVNDKFGHVRGDDVLRDIASLLKERCRKVDKIFRLGGEEFLILLYNTTLQDANNISEEFRISISKTKIIANHSITVSLGLAAIKSNENYLAWIKRADDKLYLAKENGRNRIEL